LRFSPPHDHGHDDPDLPRNHIRHIGAFASFSVALRHHNRRRHPSLPFAEVEQRTQPPRVDGQTSALRLAVCIDAKAPAALSLLPAPMSGSKWKPMCDHRDAFGHAKR
jgi:hypothetical protein